MSLLPPRTAIAYDAGKLRFIDQRRLPGRLVVVETSDWMVVRKAIKSLAIRGAPLIGVAASLAVACEGQRSGGRIGLRNRLTHAIEELRSARPTAVNLFHALDKMQMVITQSSDGDLPRAVEFEALRQLNEDRISCDRIGANGLKLVPQNASVLTICNTGWLATAGIGTALGMIYKAFDAGKIRKVFALETRPLLQGARLTAWELTNSGVPITLLPDGAAASLLKQEGIDLAIIGADRIAANGDTANKIGSLALAICCKRFNVPLYIAAPTATIDPTLTGGSGIPIEIRSGEEVTHFGTYRSAPVEIEAYNPAFDVVDAELISGFVTESGIIKPPYRFA